MVWCIWDVVVLVCLVRGIGVFGTWCWCVWDVVLVTCVALRCVVVVVVVSVVVDFWR